MERREHKNIFKSLQTRCNTVARCSSSFGAGFIQNHVNSTKIDILRTKETIPCVLTFTDALGADETFVFTYEQDDAEQLDYFKWKKHHFFLYERVHVVADLGYKKFKAMECNVLVNDKFWAFLKGPLKTVKDTSLLANGYDANNNRPLLVCPINEDIRINETIIFNNQSWNVLDADYDSVKGIGFYYIERGMNSQAAKIEEQTEEVENSIPTAYVGREVTLPTQNGFIKAEGIEITKRTFSQVSFKPIQSGLLTVTVKGSEDDEVYTFEIKETI